MEYYIEYILLTLLAIVVSFVLLVIFYELERKAKNKTAKKIFKYLGSLADEMMRGQR